MTSVLKRPVLLLITWSREEWDVALAGGGLLRIYRDRLREAWFVEGELD